MTQGGHTGHKWIGYTLFVPLDRPTAGGNAEQQTDDSWRTFGE